MGIEKSDVTLAYFPFFAGDWLSSTSVTLMLPEHEATYVRLLCHQWRHGFIPGDPAEIQMLTKLPVPATWKRAWQKLEQHFPLSEDGNRRNGRLENERRKSLDRHTQQVEAGQRSANARAARKQQNGNERSNDRSTDVPTHAQTKPRTKPSTKRQQSESEEEYPQNSPDGELHPPHAEPQNWQPPEQRSAEFSARLETALTAIPDSETRTAMRRLIVSERIPEDSWLSWIHRTAGWIGGMGTTGGKKLTWTQIASGTNELIDANRGIKPITPLGQRRFCEMVPTGSGGMSEADQWEALKEKARRGEDIK